MITVMAVAVEVDIYRSWAEENPELFVKTFFNFMDENQQHSLSMRAVTSGLITLTAEVKK